MRIITAFTLACATLTATAAQAQDCALQKVAALDMAMSDGIMRVPATINGKPKTVALQLGSAFNSVTGDTVKELRLHLTSIENIHISSVVGNGINGISNGYTTKADLQLGTVPLPGIGLLLYSNQSVAAGAGLAGGLGTTLLHVFDFDIDPAQGKFNLFLRDHCPGKVVYWTKDDVAEIPLAMDNDGYVTSEAELDGKPLKIKFGNQREAVMGINDALNIFGLAKDAPGMTELPAPPAWLPPGIKVYTYKFKSLSINGIGITNPTVLIVDQPPVVVRCMQGRYCFNKTDLQLGTALWSKLHLYFSGKDKVIYATPASAH